MNLWKNRCKCKVVVLVFRWGIESIRGVDKVICGIDCVWKKFVFVYLLLIGIEC